MKRSEFHKTLIIMAFAHDIDRGLMGVCDESGIPYHAMQRLIRNPRSIRWYQYESIVDALGLNKAEEDILQASIKVG